jgi:signal transduction histidine kinase
MDRLGLVARRYALEILAALIVAESAVEVAFRHHPPHPGLAWFDVLAIALVNAPLLVRRRFPFLAPAALWLLAAMASLVDGLLVVTSASSFLSGMIASFLLGNLPSRNEARVGLAIVACAGVVLIYDKPGHAEAELVFYPVLFVLVWGAGMALRERGRHVEEAERRAMHAEHQREAAAHAAMAQERARIARELHDTIAHAVSVMVLQVGAVRIKLPDAHQEHKNALQDVERAGRTALADMRHLLDAMREDGQDVSLAPLPGLDRLSGLLEEMRRAGLPVRLSVTGEEFPLPGGADVSAYRIVQEGLTNVLKHANATHAEVSLRYAPDQVDIEVHDDGRGATPGSATSSSATPGSATSSSATSSSATSGNGHRAGHGLIGIRERVRLYDGDMSAGTSPDGGFLLRARLPLAGIRL